MLKNRPDQWALHVGGIQPKAMIACGFAICSVTIILFSGCSDGRPERVLVSGNVFIDGKPLTHGSIMLVPKGGRPSMANLNERGHFTLGCYDREDGTVRGRYAVKVMGAQAIGEDTVRWFAPKKYADCSTSGLEVEIDAPTDQLRIDLSWNGGAPFVDGPKH